MLTAREQEDVASVAVRIKDHAETLNDLGSWWAHGGGQPSALRVAIKYMIDNNLAVARTVGGVKMLGLAGAERTDQVAAASERADAVLREPLIELAQPSASKPLRPPPSAFDPPVASATIVPSQSERNAGAPILDDPAADPTGDSVGPSDPVEIEELTGEDSRLDEYVDEYTDATGRRWISVGEAKRRSGRSVTTLKNHVTHKIVRFRGTATVGAPSMNYFDLEAFNVYEATHARNIVAAAPIPPRMTVDAAAPPDPHAPPRARVVRAEDPSTDAVTMAPPTYRVETIHVTLNPTISRLIAERYETGLYGGTPEDVARELIYRCLRLYVTRPARKGGTL